MAVSDKHSSLLSISYHPKGFIVNVPGKLFLKILFSFETIFHEFSRFFTFFSNYLSTSRRLTVKGVDSTNFFLQVHQLFFYNSTNFFTSPPTFFYNSTNFFTSPPTFFYNSTNFFTTPPTFFYSSANFFLQF